MFERDDTQRMLGDMVGRLLAESNGFEARRMRLNAVPPDRLALWSLLADQGVLGAGVDEAHGGFGGALRDIATVMAAVGEGLVVEPVLAAFLSAFILARADDRTLAGPWLERLVRGDAIVIPAFGTFAVPPAKDGLAATRSGGSIVIDGQLPAVRHADLADALIVAAVLDDDMALLLVEKGAEGCSIEGFRLIDGASAGAVTLSGTPARLLGGDAGVVDEALARALTGLAAETAAICAAVNRQTFLYLQTRQQFGAKLASFQALQHRAVDMHIAAEETQILVEEVLDAADAGGGGVLRLACAAKAYGDEAGRRVGHEGVQLHGGMGVSDELDISHYMRRLAAIRAEIASAATLRACFAALDGREAMAADRAELAAFREEVRAFVREALPADLARKSALGLELGKEDFVRWQKILRDKGWFAAAWPQQFGGAGWDLERQLVFVQESAINNAPMIIPYGVNMVGPVLHTFGTEAQQRDHLPGILSSEIWWCQGYSEPGSGSDLASLKTSAVRDGNDYIVNGTKMWTTEAHWADMMHCLVRTEKGEKPQRGISFLLIDMTAPGITVRPIVTIDGQHHTNQIFFDDVRVPVANLVGEEGQGWTIAKFLLANERVAIADTGPKLKLLAQIKALLREALQAGALSQVDAVLLPDRLAGAEIALSALCAMEARCVRAWADGAPTGGPEASMLKIRGTEVLQALSEIALAIEGPLGAAHDPADLHLPPDANLGPAQRASLMAHHYLYGRCWSIFGGTNEIQRNIIAQHILG